MKISARCEYACRAVLELAMHWPKKEPVQIEEIANKQNIPVKYLVHILLQLKMLGFVESLRGKDGGYILHTPPNKIKLGRIIKEISGPFVSFGTKDNLFSPIWLNVEKEISKVLDNVTFDELANKAKGGVYYI